LPRRRLRLLEKAAQNILGLENAKLLMKGVDIIGDIAVVKFPDELKRFNRAVARELLKEAPYLKVVLQQSSPVSGKYRLRRLSWLAGERRKTTFHREYGCLYKVDLEKTYFSPRLSAERHRIASQLQLDGEKGEIILNMFAGVGCFSILIAKRNKACKIYSIDLNKHAVELMVYNAYLNKVRRQVTPILGEARQVSFNLFQRKVDRVLMPLPEKAKEYLHCAAAAVKPEGGIIHYQTFIHTVKNIDPTMAAEWEVRNELKNIPHEILFSKVIREVGPRWFHVAVDVRMMRVKSVV
jgi:tRNA (guanine37-N1)-methyltransferase